MMSLIRFITLVLLVVSLTSFESKAMFNGDDDEKNSDGNESNHTNKHRKTDTHERKKRARHNHLSDTE